MTMHCESINRWFVKMYLERGDEILRLILIAFLMNSSELRLRSEVCLRPCQTSWMETIFYSINNYFFAKRAP